MRLDEYLHRNSLTAVQVERFDGFEVEVEGPSDWEVVDSRPGLWIWAWRDDPCLEQFCANAVLTMHRVPLALDPAQVFSMLSNEQVHLVPNCSELQRELGPGDDGISIHGVLALRIDSELGPVNSVSHSQIIATDHETLIAQLTVTALRDSPVDWKKFGLSVVHEGVPTNAEPLDGQSGRPISAHRSVRFEH